MAHRTRTTPWAATYQEHAWEGASHTEALAAAAEWLCIEVDAGHAWADDFTVELHRDVLWCCGPPADDPEGDCYCGSDHDGFGDMAFTTRETLVETVTVRVSVSDDADVSWEEVTP